MPKALSSVVLDAPPADPNKAEGQSFTMTMHWVPTGGGGDHDVNLYWEYRYNATWYAIPVTANGLYTNDNEEELAASETNYNRTIQCNTEGTYYVRARAYDFDDAIEKVSGEQVVTVTGGEIKKKPSGC